MQEQFKAVPAFLFAACWLITFQPFRLLMLIGFICQEEDYFILNGLLNFVACQG